jgi:hypothetical protein
MESTTQIALETIKNLSVEDFLNLLRQKETLVVQVSSSESVRIKASLELLPLPKLDGYVPQGWKDAIYHE